jgi:hypothetical protein
LEEWRRNFFLQNFLVASNMMPIKLVAGRTSNWPTDHDRLRVLTNGHSKICPECGIPRGRSYTTSRSFFFHVQMT